MPIQTKVQLYDIAYQKFDGFSNRPTIVFLHDSLGCIALWRDFPQLLGTLSQCNVLIYDRQGYGKSCNFSYKQRTIDYLEQEADILIDLLHFWQLDQAILFGHSDGGSIALIAAAKYPAKIRGLIAEGAHVFVEDITLNGIVEAVELYQTSNLKQKLEKYHGGKTEAMVWAWADTWLNENFRQWSIEHFLPHIQCPIFIIQGELDEYGSLEQVNKIMNQTNTKSSKLIIPQLKHTPHKENPDLILEQSNCFIQGLI